MVYQVAHHRAPILARVDTVASPGRTYTAGASRNPSVSSREAWATWAWRRGNVRNRRFSLSRRALLCIRRNITKRDWTSLRCRRAAVIAAHLVFVLPYVFLSLADPWRAWDARHSTVARALGASRDRVLWAVRLPMLLRPVLTAAAVGFAVSVGQYLPTLLVGGGRVQTLTTEAVALVSGGDRRAIGVYALAQTLAALAPFALAILLPRLFWRHRRGMRDG